MIESLKPYKFNTTQSLSFKNKEQQVLDTKNNAMANSVTTPTLVAYMNNIYNSGVNVDFFNTLNVQQMQEKYGLLARQVKTELSQRASQNGQVLNWIGELPQAQLQRIDEIYAMANSMKKNGSGKLGIIGIGGSRHTIENLLSLNGFADKAVFLSSVIPEDIDNFINKLEDIDKSSIMVASKSGTTLEPSDGFAYVRKKLGDKFKNYICITDKNTDKSKLRKIAQEQNYTCGIIHDDCGGRFGAFDDHSLVALAYCGMEKQDMIKMLKASLKAQEKYLNANLSENKALQRAVFNTESVLNNKTNQYDYYFGDKFEGTALWNTQMKKESHKAMYKVCADLIGPAFLHNSTESDLDSRNTNSFYTFNSIESNNKEENKAYNALLNGSLIAYKNMHPVSHIKLKNLSPESIGEFVELKHFETIYTGMMLRAKLTSSKKEAEKPDVLPEVLQPHVNIYKKEVNKILN